MSKPTTKKKPAAKSAIVAPPLPVFRYKIWDVKMERYLDDKTDFCDDIINDGDNSIADAEKALAFVMQKANDDGSGKEWEGQYEIHEIQVPRVVKKYNVSLMPMIEEA
jgi:hypothetical protein